MVGARETVRVADENLKLADTALKRAQRELELGASSPLDIYQPQANFANASVLGVTQTQSARWRKLRILCGCKWPRTWT